jgi:hypothetical protein
LFSQSDPITLPPTQTAESIVKKEEYDDPAFGQTPQRNSLPPPTPGDPVIYGTEKEEYCYDQYESGPSASFPPPPPTQGGPKAFGQEDEYDDDIDDKWMSQIDIGHLEGSSSQVPLPMSSNCKYSEEEKGSLMIQSTHFLRSISRTMSLLSRRR